MRISTHASIALLSLLIPAGVLAQNAVGVPPVRGLSAKFDGTNVTISWQAPAGIDIAYYRIYHSTTSILQNNGLYDDFEVTKGPETTLSITPPPGGGSFYAAVIAVAQNGQESPYFVEEASAGTSAVSSSSSENVMPVQSSVPAGDDTAVRVLRASVPSPGEIDVTFSSAVTVDPAHAPEGLHITAPDGSKLNILKITINGTEMAIYTETQLHGVVYNVRFSEPFKGVNGKPLDATDRSVLVTGHKDGKAPTSAPAVRQSDPTSPPDVTNVTLTPSLERNGTYALTAEWKVDNGPKDLVYVVIYQTRDAKTFGPPSVLPVDIRGVQLRNVTPGFFGMYIRTVNVYGYASPGVFHYVSLPGYGPAGALSGQLMFGEISMKDLLAAKPDTKQIDFDAVEPATASGGLAQVEPMGQSVMYAAADVESPHTAAAVPEINWIHAAVLAGIAAASLIFLLGAVIICQKRNRSPVA